MTTEGAALWRAVFDAYPDGVLLVDRWGRIVRANQAAVALLGYSIEELSGLAIEALVPDAARGRHAADREGFQRAPRVRPMGTQLDLAARRRDGSHVLVEIALSPLDADDGHFVLAAIRGVGEYPRVKQALRRARHAEGIAQMGRLAVDSLDADALLAEAPFAAADALDAEAGALHVLDANARLLRHFGTALAQPVTVAEIIAARPLEGASTQSGFGLMLAVPVTVRGRTLGRLEVHRRAPRAFDADDQRFLASLASLLATVLQRSASEAALNHAQRLEAVGQLTGGIAHDFNNLLTVIQGNLQVLADLPGLEGDPNALELVAAATRASRRGADLTAKLLAFSRRQVLQPEAIDLARTLGPLADLLRRTLDARIAISVDVEPGCPRCLADAGQLESALLNIAINARDAMPEGGVLAFSAWRCDAPPLAAPLAWDGPGVALAITDSGSGMSEAVMARAFEPFFTTKDAGRGTGLGLATVYGFAQQSHGAVTLASRPGQTTVTLYLPGPPGEGDPHGAAVGVRQAASVPAGLAVLLVEDEPEVLRIVQTFLGTWGCHVSACSEADAALAALAAPDVAFDLLVSDVVLGPGLRGTELAVRAQALRPGLPVLLMSGYAYAAGDAPAQPLLRKPFTREQLAEAIVRALGPR